MSDLQGRVIIVTGASSGIGKSAAIHLAKRGATVVLVGRNEGRLNAAVEEIKADGGNAVYYIADVSVGDEIKELVDWTAEKFGALHGIFNNAGIGLVKPFLEMDPESYLRVIEVDQHSVYYGMYYAAKKMVELGIEGVIVNNASIYGTIASVGSFNYNAAKAATIMMTKSGALELAQYGIRVVGVAPGFIDTPILGDDEEFKHSLEVQHLREKLIQPEKVATVVGFLFSDCAHAVNGHTLPVDDGFLSFKTK